MLYMVFCLFFVLFCFFVCALFFFFFFFLPACEWLVACWPGTIRVCMPVFATCFMYMADLVQWLYYM